MDFDRDRLVTIGERLARVGVDPCALLERALGAECEVSNLAESIARRRRSEASLGELLEANNPAGVDILEAPTFRKRLREARVALRTWGQGAALYSLPPEEEASELKVDWPALAGRLRRAHDELKAVGKALLVIGPAAPKRRKPRFEELYLEQRPDGSTVLDGEVLPRFVSFRDVFRKRGQLRLAGDDKALRALDATYRPVEAIERARREFEFWVSRAMLETKGKRRLAEVLAALEVGNGTPPPLRPELAKILADQRKSFPKMTAEEIALCWAYGMEVAPESAAGLKRRFSARDAMRRQRAPKSD